MLTRRTPTKRSALRLPGGGTPLGAYPPLASLCSSNEKTTFVIVDAQRVKNMDLARQKGYDAGKKVFGIKRHRTVDIQGLPHAIARDHRGCHRPSRCIGGVL